MRNLLQKGYEGAIYPINVREEEVLGIKAYRRLSDVPGEVELVVLITPAAMIYEIMDDFDKRMEEKVERCDVKAIVCAAADYGETKTEEGIRRQNRLMDSCKKYGARLLGPNCIGIINNQNGADTTFVEPGIPHSQFKVQSGISVISQSGAIATTMMFMGSSRALPVKFNKFVSMGNMTDVDFIDALEYYEKDETTTVIGVYLEGYSDGKLLIETMGRIAKKKPVVVFKVGKGEAGAKAASSHTGSLTGSDAVYDAAFKQYGIIRAATFGEFMDTLLAMERIPKAKGSNFYILSQTGGFGIFCTDLLEAENIINMSKLSEESSQALRKQMPPMAAIDQPEGYSDITATANEEQHAQALTTVLKDENVDGVFFLTVTPPFLGQEKLGRCIVQAYNELANQFKKPVFVCIMAGGYVKESRRVVEEGGMCTFDTPYEAVNAAKHLIWYSEYMGRKEGIS